MKIIILGPPNYNRLFSIVKIENLVIKNLPQQLEFTDSYKEQIKGSNLVVFTGGFDVSPSLYGESANKFTKSDYDRDSFESEIYNFCFENQIPMLGICRGAQFLTAMQKGGRLFQHIEGHTDYHPINIKEDEIFGDIIEVSSTHHQAMNISGIPEAILFGYSIEPHFTYWDEDSNKVETNQEYFLPEIVLYPSTKCLAVQGHPEHNFDTFAIYVNYLIQNHLVEFMSESKFKYLVSLAVPKISEDPNKRGRKYATAMKSPLIEEMMRDFIKKHTLTQEESVELEETNTPPEAEWIKSPKGTRRTRPQERIINEKTYKQNGQETKNIPF